MLQRLGGIYKKAEGVVHIPIKEKALVARKPQYPKARGYKGVETPCRLEVIHTQNVERCKTMNARMPTDEYKKLLGLDKKERNHEEDDLTCNVAKYLEVLKKSGKVLCYSHIPQETFTKSWGIKMKNKKMGVRSGVPDMLVVFPGYVLFLELKREKGGVLSDAQKEWLTALDNVGGNVVSAVANGWKQAEGVINQMLKVTSGK